MAAGKASKSNKKKAKKTIKLRARSPRTRFLERVTKSEIGLGKEIRINPPDQVKLSQVLLDFAAPVLERFDREIPAAKLIGIATAAWNLSLLPAKKRNEELDKMLRELSLDTQGVKEMKSLIGWLVDRKGQYFAEHRRFIVDFQVSEGGTRRRLYVVSSPVVSSPDPENHLPEGG